MRGGQKARNISPMATAHVFSGNWRLLRNEERDRGGLEPGGQTSAALDVVRGKSIASMSNLQSIQAVSRSLGLWTV